MHMQRNILHFNFFFFLDIETLADVALVMFNADRTTHGLQIPVLG